ncbi:MAG: preprotein translocase subunit SecE [Pseudomonadales bacterium]
MSASASMESPKLDILKWGVVIALVGAGIAGNAYFADESLLYRLLALLVLAAVAGFVALQTAKGRSFWQLLKDARVEIRKVVWPTKSETQKTTLIVMAVVVLVGLLLWALDSLLSLAVSGIIG